MNERLQELAGRLVASTREYVFIRPEDRVIILRPNQLHHLNESATWLLNALYAQDTVDVQAVIQGGAERYGISASQIEVDLERLLGSLVHLLQERTDCATAIRSTPFGSHQRLFPVLSEIALTYRCQNRCFFCYADSPHRGRPSAEMSTDQVCRVIDIIVDQARVPTVSFTGGEPTLRHDLPQLVQHARRRGLRVNLISNGIACGDEHYTGRLVDAGLQSAQVSLEAGQADIHDMVVGNAGAFDQTVRGIRNLRAAGIHTHTNTTINSLNQDSLLQLIDFVAGLGSTYLSMNMVIRTGGAVQREELGYGQIGELVLRLKEHAERRNLRFVWYSPLPYCLLNTPAHGLGAQSCAAADGLLSIAPDGSVLPCSSFEGGLGNVLSQPFTKIWNRRAARYWRNKEFVPPGCRECEFVKLCCGACPLYWDERGSFDELAGHSSNAGPLRTWLWKVRRRLIGRARGVGIH